MNVNLHVLEVSAIDTNHIQPTSLFWFFNSKMYFDLKYTTNLNVYIIIINVQ